jgi:DNA-binding LacI/PurR family transcriptional regulator
MASWRRFAAHWRRTWALLPGIPFRSPRAAPAPDLHRSLGVRGHYICAFPQRSNFDLVGIDNFGGGYLLADHLIKLGAKRLAFVTRPFSATTVDARKAGATAACSPTASPSRATSFTQAIPAT